MQLIPVFEEDRWAQRLSAPDHTAPSLFALQTVSGFRLGAVRFGDEFARSCRRNERSLCWRRHKPSVKRDADGGRVSSVHHKSRARRQRTAKRGHHPPNGLWTPCVGVRGEAEFAGTQGPRQGSVVLLAESRLDGIVLGNDADPDLSPQRSRHRTVGRASVVAYEQKHGRGHQAGYRPCRTRRVVKFTLFKGLHFYCTEAYVERHGGCRPGRPRAHRRHLRALRVPGFLQRNGRCGSAGTGPPGPAWTATPGFRELILEAQTMQAYNS